jgi:anti-sigma-K factor RskA
MIDEQQQDLASEYALGNLDSKAARAFEAELAANPELRVLTDELREAAAALAHLAPKKLPPPELRERVLSSNRAEAAASQPAFSSPVQSGGFGILPWALAASLAVSTAAFWYENNELKKEAASLLAETLDLRNRDALARVRIATLAAQVEAYSKTTAVIIWDPQKQRGIVKLSNLPRPEAGKDYQLWVIDAKYPNPVNGGILPVGEDGIARVAFTPDQPVKKADKFAISVEPAGGVPKATGPIVLVGE